MADSPFAPLGSIAPPRVTLDGAIEIKQPPPSAGKGKDLWDKLGALAPLLSGVLVAVVAYFLTDSVNTALKREELQLSNVTEMRALLLSLEGPKQEEWRAAALALSAFGAPAVPPLVAALSSADEIRTPIIEAALRGIGLGHPAAVCAPMVAVIDNRTARFTWLMHKSAIRLIGDLACRDAAVPLRRYAAVVDQAIASGDLSRYNALVDGDTPVNAIGFTLLSDDLKRTMRLLESQ